MDNYFSLLNASSLDPSQVTILELYSSQELESLIKPSLGFLLRYYAQRYPRYLLRLALKFDWLYIALMAPVELYYQRTFNSSFAEHFYGLKRVSVAPLLSTRRNISSTTTKTRLSRTQIYSSVAATLVLPYIKDLLDQQHELIKGDNNDNNDDLNLWKKFIKNIYPYLGLGTSVANVVLSVLYLFQNTCYHCLSDWILGIRYARLSLSDITRKPKSIPQIGFNSLTSLLATLMFILRLADWYRGSNLAHQLAPKRPTRVYTDSSNNTPPISSNSKNSFPVPYQPSPIPPAPPRNGQCSICNATPPNNPTALETGFVFCYPCIYKFLSSCTTTHPYCPVSGQKLWKCRLINDEWDISGCLLRLMI